MNLTVFRWVLYVASHHSVCALLLIQPRCIKRDVRMADSYQRDFAEGFLQSPENVCQLGW
jgi:hypothetical protein